MIMHADSHHRWIGMRGENAFNSSNHVKFSATSFGWSIFEMLTLMSFGLDNNFASDMLEFRAVHFLEDPKGN